ncbi:O-antigen ligase family protein [Tessaracoccus caeni]|uniref:O-antigen ligase family protein n=1 Tax=Tessaracoccus caeni TaxID=3031239 RepID=UPI0023DC9C6F|nr:O-antigen ligase family protein [Tessaracoccus caeni]MDF1489796.1 O-antigen ligase family protein [Tessaracoccus caeni]
MLLPLAEWRWGADAGVPLRLVVAALVLVAAVVAMHSTRVFLDRRLLVAAGVVLGFFLISGLIGPTPLLSVLGRFPRYEGLGMLLLYLALAAAGAVAIGGTHLVQQALLALTVLQVILAGQALWDLAQGTVRVVTAVGNASDLGVVGVTGFALLLWHALEHRFAWLWVGSGAAALVVVVSASRGAWLGLVVVVAGAAVTLMIKKRVRAAALLGALLVGLGLLVIAIPATRERLLGVGLASRTVEGRLLMWQDALRLGAEQPWLGIGPSRFVDEVGALQAEQWSVLVGPENPPDSPHNVLLQVWASTGVPGLLAFVAFAVLVAVLLWRRGTVWSTGALLAAVGVGVALCFHFTTLWALGPVLLCVGGGLAVPLARRLTAQAGVAIVATWAAMFGVLTMSAEFRLLRDIEAASAGYLGAVDSLEKTLSSRSWDPDFVRRGGYAILALAEQGLADTHSVVPLLESACARLPRSTECAQTLGNAQFLNGQSEDAVRTFERALDYAPANADTWLWLADAQAGSGDLESAVASLTKVTELRPEDSTAWDGLSAAFERMGDAHRAAEAQAEAEARR